MARAQATYEEYIAKAQAEELERERKALLRNEQLHKRLIKLFKEPPYVERIQESARLWKYIFERPRVSGLYGVGIHLTVAHKREWSYGFKPDNKTVPLPCYLESPYDHQRE
ncbi:hypothetical protein ACEUBT_05655, partial [Aeromonas bivalvium]|uniref:hypothetical protein n=1 Tax=Aeromonas bivalvium TaxID=440079 RepID=UPI0038D1681A